MSCDRADAPDSTRPATTAKIVAKATADTNDIKMSPPSASANNGAAMLPAGFSAIIASAPTKAAAPKPKKIVKMEKIPTIQVAQITEERAVLPSLTVKNRIRICGKPAVPNTRTINTEIVSKPFV